MAIENYPDADAYRIAYNVDSEPCQSGGLGDMRGTWHKTIRTLWRMFNHFLKAAGTGQMMFGFTDPSGKKYMRPATVHGVVQVDELGEFSFAPGAVFPPAPPPDDGSITPQMFNREASTNYAVAVAELDLSGAAQDEVFVLCAPVLLKIISANFVYTEATSSDAGCSVALGTLDSANLYIDFTSESDKAKGTSRFFAGGTLGNGAFINADSVVVVSTVGGKTGTGKIRAVIEWRAADTV